MNLAKFFQKGNFRAGFICGIVFSVFLGLVFLSYPKAHARKPSQMDIIYRVVAQNFYQVQKTLAHQQTQMNLLMLLAEKNKIKNEKVLPITNRLQQEIFTLDLKIKELNE